MPTRSQKVRVVLIEEGEGVVFGDFAPVKASTGELVLVPPWIDCGCISLARIDAIVALLDPGFLEQQVKWIREFGNASEASVAPMTTGLPRIARPDSGALEKLQERFAQVLTDGEHRRQPRDRVVRATELVYALDAIFSERPHPTEELLECECECEPVRGEVQSTIDTMRRQYSSRLRVSDLARAVWMSESGLRRAFRADTGLSPQAYLRRLRLAQYEAFVVETTLPLAEAARRVGWSASYARGMFASSRGVSPRDYRRQVRERG